MAEPIDSAYSVLDELSPLLQEQYDDGFHEQIYYHEDTFVENKMFMPTPVKVVGDGKTFHMEVGYQDSLRPSTNFLSDFPAPNAFDAAKIKVRFDPEDPDSTDFASLKGKLQVTHADLMPGGTRASAGAVVDLVETLQKRINNDFNAKMAILRQLPKSGRIALVNGTPVENDAYTTAAATATADNTDGIRFKVDNGSIAPFQRGLHVDFYTSAGVLNAGNIEILDPNFSDESIGGRFNSTGIQQSSGDLANVADNDEIYFSGARNQGIHSMGSWFSTPVASENFIGGYDRTDIGSRWLIPITVAGAGAQISKDHFDTVADAMGLSSASDQGYCVFGHLKLMTTLRKAIGEDAFIQFPLDDSRAKRFGNFGMIGLNWQHPTFGLVKLLSSALCPPSQVRFLRTKDWMGCYYGKKGLDFVPVSQGSGAWYRPPAATAGRGAALVWMCDYMVPGVLDFCVRPGKQAVLDNVTA